MQLSFPLERVFPNVLELAQAAVRDENAPQESVLTDGQMGDIHLCETQQKYDTTSPSWR
jgi:hypothetical protein